MTGWFSSVAVLAGAWMMCSVATLVAQDVTEVDPAAEVPAKEAVTTFGGFTVVGSAQSIRGGIASLAEKMRSELAAITGEKGRKLKLPIIIDLYGKQGDKERKRSVVSKIEQIQGNYQLRIHIHLAQGVDHKRLRYHLMEMLLYERGLSAGKQVAEGEYVWVKPWLIEGMLEAIDIKAGRANRKIYQVDMAYFEIMDLQQVFDTSEVQRRAMDGRKPIAFRAISGAMVNTLLRQPGGRRGMASYLSEVATFKGEEENLMRKHFPSMNKSQSSLEKWVDLEMAELGTAKLSQVYSMLETEKRLESVLRLRYRDKDQAAVSVGVDGYREILKLDPSDRVAAVAGARAEMERLSYRCFPNYRPLMEEYEMILGEVASGKDEGIQGRLNKLSDVRFQFQEVGKRTRDYLDWYYITQSDEVSGDFEQYRELSEALQRESMKLRVDDSTQKYLDGVQKMYGEGGE